MSATYEVVIVGGGIAGGELAAVLARGGVAVGVLELDPMPIDRVSGGRIRRRILSQLRWPPTPIQRGDRVLQQAADAGLGSVVDST